MGKIIFITGGVKSGKSSCAVKLAHGYKRRAFLATAVAFDDEMKKRIEEHKKRRGDLFETKEEPVYLSKALKSIRNADVCVVDCITVWMGNLMHYNKPEEIDNFKTVLKDLTFDLIIVSNEVGMGIMPDNRMARRYLDLLGELNREIAEMADSVFLMISGIALKIKGGYVRWVYLKRRRHI